VPAARFAAARWRLLPLAAVFLASLAYLAVELRLLGGRLGLPLDDSWIHLVFARHLAAGQGLSINPGEWVAGSTAPLWSAILALFAALPGSLLLWTQVAGVVCLLAAVNATYGLARDLELDPPLAALLATAAGLSEGLLWSGLSGMEVPLFTALALWGIRRHRAELAGDAPVVASPVIFALAALARPEGALLLGLALLDRLMARRLVAAAPAEPGSGEPRRSLLWALLGVVVLLLPVAIFNWAASGSPLPTTYAAKTAPGGLHLPRLVDLFQGFGVLFSAQPVAALLAGGGAVELLRRASERRERSLLLVAWLFGLPLAYACLPAGNAPLLGNFGRYLYPLFPPLVLVAGVALSRLGGAGARQPALRRAALALLSGLLLIGALAGAMHGAVRYGRNLANLETSHLRLVRWLAGRLPPSALVAVNDLGVFGYFLPNRVIDLGGIATPELPAYLRQRAASGVASAGDAAIEFLAERRPDYVVAFASPRLPYDRRPEIFHPVLRLAVPDNITLAGDELVLYATQWNEHPLAEPAAGAAK